MTPKRWDLVVAGPARRSIDRLPDRIAAAVLDFLAGPLAQNPFRVGKELRSVLAEVHSARVGVYRVLYEINEESRTVLVLYVDHRADVYRPR